jgi:hypothetical protein
MDAMHGLIEPLLNFNHGMGEVVASLGRQELVGDAVQGEGVVIGDGALMADAQDGSEVEALGHRPPGVVAAATVWRNGG